MGKFGAWLRSRFPKVGGKDNNSRHRREGFRRSVGGGVTLSFPPSFQGLAKAGGFWMHTEYRGAEHGDRHWQTTKF